MTTPLRMVSFRPTVRIYMVAVFFLLLMSVALASPSFATEENMDGKLLTPKQMKENMKHIKGKMLEKHLDPYHFYTKEQYAKLYKEILSRLDKPMTPIEFFFIANSFLVGQGDAHSGLRYQYKTDYLPLKLTWLPDGLGIIEAPLNPEIERSMITAIEGVSTDIWLERIAQIRDSEGVAYLRWGGEKFMKEQWVYAHFTDNPEIKEIKISAAKDGKLVKTVVQFLPPDEYRKTMKIIQKPDAEVLYDYRFMDEISAGYFELKSCIETPEYLHAADDFMNTLISNDYHNLIIDLRENSGGVSAAVFPFLKYMRGDSFFSGKLKKNFFGQVNDFGDLYWNKPEMYKNAPIFEGNVFVLISQHTFSSANDFAATFQQNGLGKLVGQKTSNAPCCYGGVNITDLPHGEFIVRISGNYVEWPGLCENDGLKPDIDIPFTLEDALKDHDPVMDWLSKNLK